MKIANGFCLYFPSRLPFLFLIGAGDGYVVVRGGVTYDFRNDSVGGMLQVGYQFDREDREAKK